MKSSFHRTQQSWKRSENCDTNTNRFGTKKRLWLDVCPLVLRSPPLCAPNRRGGFWSLNDRREEWRVRKRNEKDAWRGSVPFLSPAIFLYIGDLRIPIRPRLNFLFMAKPLQYFLIIHEIIMKREVRVYSTGKVIPRSRRENNAFQFPGKR